MMLHAFGADFKSPQGTPAFKVGAVIPAGAEVEAIMDEDFSKWTKGSQGSPSDVEVTDEEMNSLMDYAGEWVAFRTYEAGGAAYLGFDEVGSEGPGYIMTPDLDFMNGPEGYWHLSCRVKNVNPDAQDAQFQLFSLDGEASTMVTASALPMEYGEWTVCEWVGPAKSAATKFMLFGWQGKILMDQLKVEKLIYPLATPVVNGATLNTDGTVTCSWQKVEGATNYKVEISTGFDTMAEEEVGDVDSCVMSFDIDPEMDYVVYVTALAEGKTSYYGYKNVSLVAPYVGDAVALAALDVTAEGFNAIWERADYATKYLVMPVLTHTAAEREDTFYILNETFANVPMEADMNAPIQICPMMGFGGIDIYMSRAGWSVDMGMFVRMIPEMPMLALTDMYADYGLEGSLMSPVTDFSVGGGYVEVVGMGLSAVDDVAMMACLIDADGEMYAWQDFEVSTEGDFFDVVIEGGQPDSRLVIKIVDSVEGGDMVLLPMLSVAVSLDEGETITVPAETVHCGNVTSQRVECPVDQFNAYTYAVQGYVSSQLMGGISEQVAVSGETAVVGEPAEGVSVVAESGCIRVLNPAGEECTVLSLDGKIVAAASCKDATFEVGRGVYLVKVGNASFKVAL